MKRSPDRPSLGFLQRQRFGGWVWLHCTNPRCGRSRPVALAPFIIRWGPDTSSDALRRNALCLACGGRGANLILPSWRDSAVGHTPFPVAALSPLDDAKWQHRRS
ncbi:MAG: hypothetical protein GC202_02005 [Alphaproteobacteria bacterium]|nr:hypothetical protein [Alphaproteobacteria bacterium]